MIGSRRAPPPVICGGRGGEVGIKEPNYIAVDRTLTNRSSAKGMINSILVIGHFGVCQIERSAEVLNGGQIVRREIVSTITQNGIC